MKLKELSASEIAYRDAFRFFFAVGVAVLCFTSVFPRLPTASIGMSDKVQHMLAYACVAFCGAAGFHGWRHLAAMAGGLILLGVALELVQLALPDRVASVADVGANALGVLAGFVACAITGLLSHSYKTRPPGAEGRGVGAVNRDP